ncbi:COG1361 family protein [Stieleria varia]|nr:DUF11 domain-containing protein [Stieleria varia]
MQFWQLNDRPSSNRPRLALSNCWLLILLAAFASTGCSRLRLPAVDSTGQRIFAPLPTTTSLALPCSQCKLFGCLGCNGDPLNLCPLSPPEPAFTTPIEPPPCLTPAPAVVPQTSVSGQTTGPCVPSQPCNGECKDGPPAVILGRECLSKNYLKLPTHGKRGCILLSPNKIVAPVGGEVVLLSGVCGTDGYLQVGEPLEWMLTPESVGTFIEVGDDDPGVLHRLAHIKKPSKKDGSYAIGVTSTKRTLITRGNLKPGDDVQLEKGQTWITLSSPSEGTSKVTVLAPESDCWDQRKATATIYWIDAKWQFPGTKIEPAGTPIELITRVTRSEGVFPAEGWIVRYEILNPELATFAGTGGSSVVEAKVDAAGNARAELIPNPGTSGTATIAMQVIRPGGVTDNIPTLPLGQGQTFVTWSSPQLSIRAGAPEVASFNVPVQAVANVSNPGNEPLDNVVVSVQFPPEILVRSNDAFAKNLTNSVVWDIGTLPPQTQLDLFANVTTPVTVDLTFEARSASGLVASDSIRIDVYRPSLLIEKVEPRQQQYEVGQEVIFDIDVKNTGDRPLNNVTLFARGTPSMKHELGEIDVEQEYADPATEQSISLQPGDVWKSAIVFVPTGPGRQCIQVEAQADGGQRHATEGCVMVINQPVPTPSMTSTLSLVDRDRFSVGEDALFRATVANNGRVPLTNVRVAMTYDPQLQAIAATADNGDPPRPGQYIVSWTIPRIDPGTSTVLESQFRAIGTNSRSQLILTAESNEGARASSNVLFEILPQVNAPAPPTQPGPALPPATPAPGIPGPAPIPTPGANNTPPPAAPPTRERQLLLAITPPQSPLGVDDPIRYLVKVINDSDQLDNSVLVRFNRPEGVRVERMASLSRDEQLTFTQEAGYIVLPEIRSMRPGETIDYVIVLSSNQPQMLNLQFEAVSQQFPRGTSARVQTEIVPR